MGTSVCLNTDGWLTLLARPSDFYATETLTDIGRALDAVFETEPREPADPWAAHATPRGVRPLPPGAPALIGLSGKPRSGKDAIAEYLRDTYAGVHSVAFSDAIIADVNEYLRNFPSAATGRCHELTQDNKAQSHYRHLLQAWGQVRRAEQPDYWINVTGQRITWLLNAGAQLVLVTGVRTEPERDMVLSLGGTSAWVERPGNTYRADHDIETQLDHLPRGAFTVFINDVEGDLRPLFAKVDGWLSQHGRAPAAAAA